MPPAESGINYALVYSEDGEPFTVDLRRLPAQQHHFRRCFSAHHFPTESALRPLMLLSALRPATGGNASVNLVLFARAAELARRSLTGHRR